MAKVSRPPILRIRHQPLKVLYDGVEVERLKLFRVIEI
jgi:hypothetical protein